MSLKYHEVVSNIKLFCIFAAEIDIKMILTMANEELNPENESDDIKLTYLNSKKANYTDDTALIAMKSGNKQAFNWIYIKYYRPLCFFLEKKESGETECAETSEDIIQNLFLKLWESHKTIDVKISLKAYLYSCAHNSFMDYLDKLKVRRVYYDSLMADNSEASDANNPMAMLMAKETELELERAIKSLPAKYRQIIMLKIENLSYEEIADKIGIPINSIGPKLKRAKEKLLKTLNPTS